MKGLKILRNGKILAVIFGIIFATLILNIALADVSVSSIITDKQNYSAGNVVEIKFNVTIINETGYCVLDSINFSITDGNSLSCFLPKDVGNYPNYDCNGHNINITVTQDFYNCLQYGGNNVYHYILFWQIPNNWNPGGYNINVSVSSGGEIANNTATIIDVCPPDVGVYKFGYVKINMTSHGANIVYYIYYYNKGMRQAENVTIVDYIPEGAEYVGNSLNGTYNAGTQSVTWNIGNLSLMSFWGNYDQSWGHIKLELFKPFPIFNTICNKVSINTSTKETNYKNNDYEECFNFTPIDPNYKSAAPSVVKIGEYINYMIGYENVGNGSATGVKIIDADLDNFLDETTLQIDNEGIYNNATRTITWTINKTIDPSESGFVSFRAKTKETICAANNITIKNNATIEFYVDATKASSETTNATVTYVGCRNDDDCKCGSLGNYGRCNISSSRCYLPELVTPSGGGCAICEPQPFHPINITNVTTTYQISTNISNITTPEKHCFNVECTTNIHHDKKLTTSSTKDVPGTVNITLTLHNSSNITVHTNANGEICYDFGCGIYTITIPKGVCGEECSKTITTTYGKLYITPSDLTKAKINETLTYILKDDSGNVVKNANVTIVLPDGNLVRTSDNDGKVTFNVGEKEGSYKVTVQKECYENDTLTGTIVMPKLTLICDSQVNLNATLCCYVKDEAGNAVEGANVKLTMPGGKEINLISDANGKECTNETKITGDVTATASKEGYKDSNIATSKIIKSGIICQKECNCGCIEGTTQCKKCPDCNIFGLPCWMLLLLLLLIAVLLLLLLRKNKIYADEESIDKATEEGQLKNISNKYRKIYVSRKSYDKIQRIDIGDKIKNKFVFVDLDKKGENYLKKCGDEHVARAKQLDVDILTANDETAKKAEENNVKVKRYEKI